uniref:Putative trypsin-like salivary secreted protein n=1 Tax=Culex tarsalis TaxID=7177 RepID=A0A1Q3EV18_CULTA
MFKPICPLLIALIPLTSAKLPEAHYPRVAALLGPRNNFICNAVVLARGRLLTTADCLVFLKNETQRLGAPGDFHVVLNTSDIELHVKKLYGKPAGHKVVEKFRTRGGQRYDNKHSNEVLSNRWNEDELDYMLKGLAAYDFGVNRYASVVNVTNLMVHPEYTGAFKNDLAILELPDSKLFQEVSHPVRISEDWGFNRVVQVHGWGDIVRGTSRNMTYPMKTVEMYVLPSVLCSKQVGWHFDPTQHICLLPKKEETICLGFAGAPIVLDEALLGIVEFGNPRCYHNSTVVGIRLRPFANFLGLDQNDILSKIVSIVKAAFNFLISKLQQRVSIHN